MPVATWDQLLKDWLYIIGLEVASSRPGQVSCRFFIPFFSFPCVYSSLACPYVFMLYLQICCVFWKFVIMSGFVTVFMQIMCVEEADVVPS